MTFGYGTISQFRAFSWFQGVQPSVRISLGVHDLWISDDVGVTMEISLIHALSTRKPPPLTHV